MTELSPTQKKTANLLFVDDEPNVLKALNRLFRADDCNVQVAASGRAGLDILEKQAIDLIISDMRMPQMDGAEFLTEAAERWPDTVRILLTGYADINSTIAAVNKGKIYSYCSKPWEDSALKQLVNNALEQKRLREERLELFEIINRQNQQLTILNASLEEKVQKRTEQLKKSLTVIEQAHDTLNKQYANSVKGFAKIIEMRPGIKSGHSKYIAEKAREVALRMQMDAAEIKDVVYAGLLLQIGKMSLPEELLALSQASMSGEQKLCFIKHAQEGQNLLKVIDSLNNSGLMIRHQYEAYDGSGQPDGLTGDAIPLGARILAVVRDFINYLDGSITGMAMTTKQAKSQLFWKKKLEYDPVVVDTFLDLLGDAEINGERPVVEISWTQLQPGMEVAEVICNDILYLKDQILTDKATQDILKLRECARTLILRIRLGSEDNKIIDSAIHNLSHPK
jgi:response regulator RpfG family c-di-GMP phosphodiesterase